MFQVLTSLNETPSKHNILTKVAYEKSRKQLRICTKEVNVRPRKSHTQNSAKFCDLFACLCHMLSPAVHNKVKAAQLPVPPLERKERSQNCLQDSGLFGGCSKDWILSF